MRCLPQSTQVVDDIAAAKAAGTFSAQLARIQAQRRNVESQISEEGRRIDKLHAQLEQAAEGRMRREAEQAARREAMKEAHRQAEEKARRQREERAPARVVAGAC